VEFYESQVSNLIAKIKKQPIGPFSTEHGEELTSIISSAMSGLAASLLADYGEITFKVDRVAGLAFGGMFVVPLGVPADSSGAQVFLYFDCQLLDSLSVSTDGRQTGDTEEPAVHPSNLNLVMDVELNVSLRFGQRQMPLRDVLELASGSVIELDRMVDDPVDLFLDGKLIARGEAVIVDGNYGLRVTEIPLPVASRFIN
jgi:flagellar motor switch protein FliN/FliY